MNINRAMTEQSNWEITRNQQRVSFWCKNMLLNDVGPRWIWQSFVAEKMVVSLARFQGGYVLQNSCMFLFHTTPLMPPEKEMFLTFIFMTNKQGFSICHVTSLKLDGNCSGSWSAKEMWGKTWWRAYPCLIQPSLTRAIRSPSAQQCTPLWDRLNHQQKANNLSGFYPAISNVARQTHQQTGFGGYIISMLGELVGL